MFLFYLFRCIFPNERFELIAFLPLQATRGRAMNAYARGGRIPLVYYSPLVIRGVGVKGVVGVYINFVIAVAFMQIVLAS